MKSQMHSVVYRRARTSCHSVLGVRGIGRTDQVESGHRQDGSPNRQHAQGRPRGHRQDVLPVLPNRRALPINKQDEDTMRSCGSHVDAPAKLVFVSAQGRPE